MSDRPLTERLLIKKGYSVLFVDEPEGYLRSLEPLPDNVNVAREAEKPVDFIQVFVTSHRELEAKLAGAKARLKPGGLLWVSYPKGTSRIKADINRDTINTFAATLGLQGVAMISIDDTWSALRLKVV